MPRTATPVAFDPERHLTQYELDRLKGTYLRRPSEDNPDPREWLRWAREVVDAAPLAHRVLAVETAKQTSTPRTR